MYTLTETAPAATCAKVLEPQERRDIREFTLDELTAVLANEGEPPFRARQVMHWVWRRDAGNFDALTNVSPRLRQYLKLFFTIGSFRSARILRSADGTRKLVVTLAGGERIETVVIAAADRLTLCLSTQAGCAMGCAFCATARMALRRNLSTGEILGQIMEARAALEPGEQLTNYVFMGMGEPLANYPRLSQALTGMTAQWGLGISARRITVSTVGLVPAMERLLAEFPVNLAVSLHATDDATRTAIVPVNRRWPLRELLKACQRLPLARRRRITFEYVLLADVNDSPEDARRLVKLLAPLRAKVNLMRFNPFAGAPFKSSSREVIERFQGILQQGNLTATVRESRGQDIGAACGQLYTESKLLGHDEAAS